MPQMDVTEFLKTQDGPKSLTELALPLVAQLNSFCSEQGLVGIVQADLICIRCSTSDIYDARRKDLEMKNKFIFQSIVSGRRVSAIGLMEPLLTVVGDIGCLELCDQKPDHSQDDRISHITLVSSAYEEVMSKLKAGGVAIEETVRPHYTSADIILPSGFTIRLAKEKLIEKIKREEML